MLLLSTISLYLMDYEAHNAIFSASCYFFLLWSKYSPHSYNVKLKLWNLITIKFNFKHIYIFTILNSHCKYIIISGAVLFCCRSSNNKKWNQKTTFKFTAHIFSETMILMPLQRIMWWVGGGVKLYPCNRLWRPIRLLDVEDPTFSRQLDHRWRLGCQPYTPAVL
jgi:hypothetical protein